MGLEEGKHLAIGKWVQSIEITHNNMIMADEVKVVLKPMAVHQLITQELMQVMNENDLKHSIADKATNHFASEFQQELMKILKDWPMKGQSNHTHIGISPVAYAADLKQQAIEKAQAEKYIKQLQANGIFPSKALEEAAMAPVMPTLKNKEEFFKQLYGGPVEPLTNTGQMLEEANKTLKHYNDEVPVPIDFTEKEFVKSWKQYAKEKEEKYSAYQKASNYMKQVHGNFGSQQGYAVLPIKKQLIDAIPELKTAKAKYPCKLHNGPGDPAEGLVTDIIMHVNDEQGPCHMSKDEIAEWLETLDADLIFKTPEEQEEHKATIHEDYKKALEQHTQHQTVFDEAKIKLAIDPNIPKDQIWIKNDPFEDDPIGKVDPLF